MPLDPRMANYLAAIDAFKRQVHFSFEGPLLRKGSTRTARRRRRHREEELRLAMRAEMAAHRRRQFRGPVSVELAIFGGDPQVPTIVKAYLDALEGIVYRDDRAVEHLIVSRWGAGSTATAEKVYLRIEPLSTYVATFDYVFQQAWRVDELHHCFWEDEAPTWAKPFTGHDESEISRLELDLERQDEEDDLEEDELYAFEPELAERLRTIRQEELASLRIKRVLDQPITFRDRPGKPPDWTSPILEGDGVVELIDPYDEFEMPGSFWLPSPESDWKLRLPQEMLKRKAYWNLWNSPIKEPIALDIAVQGLPSAGKDLDNMAHAILVPFEEAFGDGCRGLVGAYRVYLRHGPKRGIRVRLLERERMEASQRTIRNALDQRLAAAPY